MSKWVVLHQMDSQDTPEKVAVIDIPDDSPGFIDLDELVADLRMKPNVHVPSMAPGDKLSLLTEEDFEFKLARGEVRDPDAAVR